MTNNGINIDKLLETSTDLPPSHFDGDFTKSSQFLLPMIDLTLRIAKLRNYLVNVFIDDENFEHDYKNPLFILLSTKDYKTPSWIDVVEILHSNKCFRHEYYVGIEKECHLIMFIFETPEKYSHDYQCFLQGKYSKMSDEYKAFFPKNLNTAVVVNGNTTSTTAGSESVIWGVLYKSNNLKEKLKSKLGLDDTTANSLEEYFDIPNPAREIFNYSIKDDGTKEKG